MLNHWPVVEEPFLYQYLDFLGEWFFPCHFDGKWTRQLKCHFVCKVSKISKNGPYQKDGYCYNYRNTTFSWHEFKHIRVITSYYAFYHHPQKITVGQPPIGPLGDEDPITLRNSWAERIGLDASFSSCACCRFCAACAWPAILALRLSLSGVFGVHHWDLAIEQYLGVGNMVVYWDTVRQNGI